MKKVLDKLVNDYLANGQGVIEAPWMLRERAFRTGFKAAVKYLDNIPFDKLLKELEEYLEEENKNESKK